MIDVKETRVKGETAVLVGSITAPDRDKPGQSIEQVTEYLDELEFLASTAEIRSIKRFTQKLHQPDGRSYVGSGKLAEIKAWMEEHDADMVIFDDELSPAQQRNIEKDLGRPVLDRPRLILDIFARRARTSHARTQVELAQYQYMLPRLTKLWTHLERQRGGTGTRGGAGEKEIETDRRLVRDRISLLKAQLKDIDKQMATQRGNRGKLVRVALVGYTNVGKSTLMNLLSKSDVFAENKLFATLDTTVRKVVVGNLPFLLSDTVGFIRKLPTQLIESFKSTLDETREADLLLHVVDISHHSFEEQYATVKNTLQEIGAGGKPTIVIFNKIDAYRPAEHDPHDLAPKRTDQFTLEELKQTWMGRMGDEECIFISAVTKDNVDALRKLLYERAKAIHVARFPYETDLLFGDEYLDAGTKEQDNPLNAAAVCAGTMSRRKQLLKRLYDALPFKQAMFSVLRLLPIPQRIYQHLHFQGLIDVEVGQGEMFRMRHHGYMIENELFWRGIKGWEKVSLELWTRLCRRSDTIIDVGANTGVYAPIAKTVRPGATIIAVEPVERVFRKLEENIALNGGGIHAVLAALTDREGEVTLYDAPHLEHVLGVSLNKERIYIVEGKSVRPVQVPGRTMAGIAAEFGLPRIDLMKIDVETHEPEVLAGFTELLRRDKPTLLIEILNDVVAVRLEEQVRGMGYLFYNIDDVTWPPEKVHTLTKSRHFNYLFCQPEVADAIGLERP